VPNHWPLDTRDDSGFGDASAAPRAVYSARYTRSDPERIKQAAVTGGNLPQCRVFPIPPCPGRTDGEIVLKRGICRRGSGGAPSRPHAAYGNLVVILTR